MSDTAADPDTWAPPTAQATDLWTAAYPTMREILDRNIKAMRAVHRPADELRALTELRRHLGQLDRGTYKPCTRSAGVGPLGSPWSTLSLIREVLRAMPISSPAAGMLYRTAAAFADLAAERAQAPAQGEADPR